MVEDTLYFIWNLELTSIKGEVLCVSKTSPNTQDLTTAIPSQYFRHVSKKIQGCQDSNQQVVKVKSFIKVRTHVRVLQ